MASATSTFTPAASSPLEGPGESPDEAPSRAAAVKRPRWWGELLAIAWLAIVYDVINNLASLRRGLALHHGKDILSLERVLHIDPELTLNRWLASHQTLGTILSDYYDNAHFIVTFALLGYLLWRHVDRYRPLRSSLVLINVIGLIVFWVYPVAPPRMLDGFADVIASTHAFGSWHTGQLASEANQYGAMPSLHIAWALWCSLALWRISRRAWVRAIAVLYPCLTAFAVLSTGNHYLLDVLAGALTFLLAVGLVRTASVAHVTKLLLSRKTGRLAATSEDAL